MFSRYAPDWSVARAPSPYPTGAPAGGARQQGSGTSINATFIDCKLNSDKPVNARARLMVRPQTTVETTILIMPIYFSWSVAPFLYNQNTIYELRKKPSSEMSDIGEENTTRRHACGLHPVSGGGTRPWASRKCSYFAPSGRRSMRKCSTPFASSASR